MSAEPVSKSSTSVCPPTLTGQTNSEPVDVALTEPDASADLICFAGSKSNESHPESLGTMPYLWYALRKAVEP